MEENTQTNQRTSSKAVVVRVVSVNHMETVTWKQRLKRSRGQQDGAHLKEIIDN